MRGWSSKPERIARWSSPTISCLQMWRWSLTTLRICAPRSHVLTDVSPKNYTLCKLSSTYRAGSFQTSKFDLSRCVSIIYIPHAFNDDSNLEFLAPLTSLILFVVRMLNWTKFINQHEHTSRDFSLLAYNRELTLQKIVATKTKTATFSTARLSPEPYLFDDDDEQSVKNWLHLPHKGLPIDPALESASRSFRRL